MNKTLPNHTHSNKIKSPVRCPFCAMTLINRCGFYFRFHPEWGKLVKIQRYLCKAPNCPVITFSILPFPLLRIVQHSYQMVEKVYNLKMEGINQASACRATGLLRGVIKRLYEFSGRFFSWLRHEQSIADWGPCFEHDPCPIWPAFIRDFSHTFYPDKFGKPFITQLIHSIYQ